MASESDTQPNLRALKIVVIVLGALIVVAAVVLGIGVTRKLTASATAPATPAVVSAPAASTPVPAAEPSLARFGDRSLALPRGARLVEVLAVADQLAVRVRLVTGAERVVLCDARSGERSGSLDITVAE
jgi:hypothetical protein